MEAEHSPGYMAPLSAVPKRYKGIQGITFGTILVTKIAERLSVMITNSLRGSTPDFPSRFNSIDFPRPVQNQGFPSVRSGFPNLGDIAQRWVLSKGKENGGRVEILVGDIGFRY